MALAAPSSATAVARARRCCEVGRHRPRRARARHRCELVSRRARPCRCRPRSTCPTRYATPRRQLEARTPNRLHHDHGAGHGDAVPGGEPDGAGAAGDDQRGGREPQRQGRLPGVPGPDGAQDEGQGRGGGAHGGVPRLRQGPERAHLRGGAPARHDQPRREAQRRRGGRDGPRGRRRRRRTDQLRGVRQGHDGQAEEAAEYR